MRFFKIFTQRNLILESAIVSEVKNALHSWIKNSSSKGVLIGGLALSFYSKPRYTQDIDVMFLSNEEVPTNVYSFKRHRKSAFEHKKTGVKIELLTPETVNIKRELVKEVIRTATSHNGINVASVEGLITLKLQRNSYKDKGDIETLLQSNKNANMESWKTYLTDDQLKTFEEIKSSIR
jgi:hypothetical protein